MQKDVLENKPSTLQFEFEGRMLDFRLEFTGDLIKWNLESQPNCLQLEMNTETNESYLDYLLYEIKDKSLCSGFHEPGFGGYLLRCVDYLNTSFNITRCFLTDASTFIEAGHKLPAGALYAKTHSGLTFYMSHKYLHLPKSFDRWYIPTFQDCVTNTNELIARLNTWWQSRANQFIGLGAYEETPLKELPTRVVVDTTGFEYARIFVKFYPENVVELVKVDANDPAYFTITEFGQSLVESDTKDQKLIQRLKALVIPQKEMEWIFTQLSNKSAADSLKNTVKISFPQLALSGLSPKTYKPGPVQFLLPEDIRHIAKCDSVFNLWLIDPGKCVSFSNVLQECLFAPNKITRDSVILILWVGLQKEPEDGKFWTRYYNVVRKMHVVQQQPQDFSSQCAKTTVDGLACVHKHIAKIGECGAFCQAHIVESMTNLQELMLNVFLDDIALRFDFAFLSGYPRTVLHDWPNASLQVGNKIECFYTSLVPIPDGGNLTAQWKGHTIDLNALERESVGSHLIVYLEITE